MELLTGSVVAKLGAGDRVQAVVLAYESGLVGGRAGGRQLPVHGPG